MIILIIIMIVIALKSAVRDITISLPRTISGIIIRSSSHGQVVCTSRTTHRTLIICNVSCATGNEGTAQLRSLTEMKSYLFELYFIG